MQPLRHLRWVSEGIYAVWRAVVPTLDKLYHLMRWFWLGLIIGGVGVRVVVFAAENGWSAVEKWAIINWIRVNPVESIAFGASIVGILIACNVVAYVAHQSPLVHPERLAVVSIRRLNLADLRYKFGANPSKWYFPRQPYLDQACGGIRQARAGFEDQAKGVIVFGIPMVGKTRLLAQALSTEATDFALLLWRKRYGSLPLTSFERFHGKRLVVMFDDIQEYASPDEAQGVLDTVERLRAICHRLIIVATSRTGIEQDITERVFGRALIEQFHLRRIYLAPFTIASDEAESFLENCRKVGIAVYRQSFDGTPGSVVLGLHTRTEQLRDPSFPGGARAILQALALLRHGRIYVYPEERVRRVAMAMFGLPSGVNDWRESLRHLTRGGWVDVNRDASGQPVIRLPTDGYLDTCVRDAEVYPVPGGHVDDDLRKLKEVLSNSNLPPDADALLLLSVTLREYVIGDQSDQARLAVDCATTALSILSPTSNSDLWARGKNTLGIAYAKLGDSRFLQAAFDAFTDALSVRTREAFPIKWAETVCNRVLVRMEIANQTPNLEERREHLVAGRAELRSTLLVFEANSERFKNVQQTIAELDALDES